MPTPAFDLAEVVIYRNRTSDLTFDLYDPAGDPLVIAADDNVRFKLWSGTDAATPSIDADAIVAAAINAAAVANNQTPTRSVVTILDLGTTDTTPARINVRLNQAELSALTPGDFFGEAILIDHSDGDVAKPLFRMPVKLEPSPAGSLSVS